MSLKAALFDFGGVLARTRSQVRRTAWEQRLGLAPGGASEIVFDGESGRAAQLGRISDAEHWRFVKSRLGLDDATLAQFRHDFFAEDALDTDLLAYVGLLRARYRTGLLSNATDAARRNFIERGVARYFDAITVSAEEGVMKPDERIYRTALARLGVAPAEAVFVDDFRQNVEVARALGLAAVHFTDPAIARRELAAIIGVDT